MNKSRLFGTVIAAIIGSLLPAIVSATTFDIGSMNITSGTFELHDSSGVPVINTDNGLSVSPFTVIGGNTNLVGGYIGDGGAGTDTIASLSFFGAIANMHTAASNLGDTNSPAGTITGGPVPSGSLDNVSNTINIDLSSWFMNWNNNDIHTGTGKTDGVTSAFATGAWDPVTGTYTLSWQSLTDSGPKAGFTALIELSGTASPVPLPAAIWLFGSGLLGLFGISRRKKA
jgi:hypothetical protein